MSHFLSDFLGLSLEPQNLPNALVSLQLRKKTNALVSKNGNLKVEGQF